MSGNIRFFHVLPSPTQLKEASTTSAESSLKGRMVKVKADSPIDDDKIVQILQKVGKDITESKERTLPEITITNKGENHSVQIGAMTINVSLDQTSSSPFEIRKMDTSFKSASTWIDRFSKQVRDLHPKNNISLGLCITFEVILFPLTFLGYSLFSIAHAISSSSHISKREKEVEKELMALSGPTSLSSFMTTIEVAHRVYSRLGNEQMLESLSTTLKYGQQIEKMIQGKISIYDLVQTITKDLGQDSQGPITLAVGSFSGNDFVPALISIEKTEDGSEYLIKKLSLSPTKESAKCQVLHSYTIANDNIENFLSGLFTETKKEPSLSSKEIKKQALMQKMAGEISPTSPPTSSGLDIFFLRQAAEKIIVEIPLKEEETPWAYASPSLDPLALLTRMKTLSKENLSLNRLREEKVDFLHLFVSELVREYTKYGASLPPEKAAVIATELQSKINKLQKKLSKCYGENISRDYITTIKSSITKQAKASSKKTTRALIQKRDELLSKPIETKPTNLLIKKKTTELAAPVNGVQTPIPTTATSSLCIEPKIWSDCQSISETWRKQTLPTEEPSKIFAKIDSVIKHATTMIENNHVEEARIVLENLLLSMPTHGEKQILDALSYSDYETLLAKCTDIQKLLIECRFQEKAPCVSTKQLMGAANSLMLANYYADRRGTDALYKILALPEGATDEEKESHQVELRKCGFYKLDDIKESKKSISKLDENWIQTDQMSKRDALKALAEKQQLTPEELFYLSLLQKKPVDDVVKTVIKDNPLLQPNKDSSSSFSSIIETLPYISQIDTYKINAFCDLNMNDILVDAIPDECQNPLQILQQMEMTSHLILAPEYYLKRESAPSIPSKIPRNEVIKTMDSLKHHLLSQETAKPNTRCSLQAPEVGTNTWSITIGEATFSYIPQGVENLPESFYSTIPLVGSDHYPLLRLQGGNPESHKEQKGLENAFHTSPYYLLHAKENPSTRLEPSIEGTLLSLDHEHTSCLTAIEMLLAHPEIISNPHVQLRIQQILTKKEYLADSLFCTPIPWAIYIKELDTMYEKLKKKNDVPGILFIAEIRDRINVQMNKIKIESKSYRETYNNTQENLEKLYKQNERFCFLSFCKGQDKPAEEIFDAIDRLPSREGKEKLPFNSILEHLDKSTDSRHITMLTHQLIRLISVEDIKGLNSDQCRMLLSAWSTATATTSSESGWDDHFIALEKMVKTLLPALMEKVNEDKSILSNLLAKKFPTLGSASLKWEQTDNSYRFAAQNAYLIDLQQGTVEDLYASKTKPPSDVPFKTLQDLHYRQVFGDLQARGPLTINGDKRSFEITKDGLRYQLEINSEDNVVQIIKYAADQTKWTHVTASLDDSSSSLAHYIKQNGLWHKEEDQTYLLSLPFGQGQKTTDITLHIDNKGKLTEAKYKDKHVCLASSDKLKDAFDVAKANEKIFLSDTPKGAITQIVFPEQGIKLERKINPVDNNETPWELSESAGWQLDDHELKRLSAFSGPQIQQIIIPFKKGDEKEYKIFARPILSSSFKTAPRIATFDMQAAAIPLSLRVNNQLQRKGSHSAFLYMAMYYLSIGKVSEASLYLEEMSGPSASVAEADKKRELATLLQLEEYLNTMIPLSDAEAAFLLKAQLSLNQLKRKTYKYIDKEPKDPSSLLKQTQRLYDLRSRYDTALKNPVKNQDLQDKKLLLTETEKVELEAWYEMAYRLLSEGAVQRANAPMLKIPEKISDHFLINLISFSEKKKNVSDRPLLDKDLIVNFFSYVDKMKTNQQIDLEYLKGDIDPSLDPSLATAIDEARCHLLMMQKTKIYPDEIPSFDDVVTIRNKKSPSEKDIQKIQGAISEFQGSLETYLKASRSKARGVYLVQTEETKAKELAEKISSWLETSSREIVQQEISELETKASSTTVPVFQPAKMTVLQFTTGPKLRENCIKTIETEQAIKKIEDDEKNALKNFEISDSFTKPQQREIHRIQQGIEEAASQRIQEINEQKQQVIDPSKINDLKNSLQDEISSTSIQRTKYFDNIIKMALSQGEYLGLLRITQKPNDAQKGEVIQALLQPYEQGKILSILIDNGMDETAAKKLSIELENDLTTFLTLSTKMYLLDKALSDPVGSISQLTALKEANISDESPEWSAACYELNKKIDRACDLTFFCKKGGELEDQELSRPALVLGYRQKIGVTQEQIDVLKRLIKDPNALEELRMGLGKSFVIAPLVASILANKGNTPVIIFTEELLQLSKKDLDPRAYEFSFQRSPNKTADELAEEYKTLLSVKASGRYIVSTIARFAALENKYHELMGQLIEKNTNIKKAEQQLKGKEGTDLETHKAALEAQKASAKELYNQIGYIKKIYQFFDPTEMGTRFIIDEVDAILHISSEINYAEGFSKNADVQAAQSGQIIFETILTSKDQKVMTLAEAIKTNKQATLPREVFDEAVNTLAQELCQNPKLQKEMGITSLTGDEIKNLVLYLCGKDAKSLESRKDLKWETINILKQWLCKTLPTICRGTYGINFGLADDGKIVVPMEGGRAKFNTMFGEECELVGYHYLGYIQEGCKDEEFFTRTCKQIVANAGENPLQHSVWGKWLQRIGYNETKSIDDQNKTLFTNFQKETNADLRADFLQFMLLHTSSIQVFKKQIPLLVQDIIGEREVAGISGSMNRKALDPSFSKTDKDPRSVTGDLLMRLQKQEGGLSAQVTTFTDPQDQMKKLCKDPDYKAIINIGSPFIGKSTKEVIAELRKDGNNRQFIYIDSESKTPMIWKANEDSPVPFDKEKDADKIDSNHCLFYFSPADTRGTDFKIPTGYGAVIPGATTTLAELEQAVWRLRKLGAGQSARFFLDENVAKRIPCDQNSIKVSDLFTDIVKKTAEDDTLANFKRQAVTPSSITKNFVKLALLRSKPHGMEDDCNLYEKMMPLYRREKSITPANGYTVEKDLDSIDYLKTLYDNEIKALDDQIEKIQDLPCKWELKRALIEAKTKIEESKKTISEDIKTLIGNTVKSSASSSDGSQCQVQQQQQQQQISQAVSQQALKIVDTDMPDREEDSLEKLYVSLNMIDMMDTGPGTQIQSANTIFDLPAPPKIYISDLQAKLLDIASSSALLPCYAITDNSNVFVLISAEELPRWHFQSADSDKKLKIYSLGNREPTPIIDDSLQPISADTKFLEKLCLAKLIIGASSFSDTEKSTLKDFFCSLPTNEREKLIKKLNSKGAIEGANLLSTWKNEPQTQRDKTAIRVATQAPARSNAPSTNATQATQEPRIQPAAQKRQAQSGINEVPTSPPQPVPSASYEKAKTLIENLEDNKRKIQAGLSGLLVFSGKSIDLSQVIDDLEKGQFTDEEYSALEKWCFKQMNDLGQRQFLINYNDYLQGKGGLRRLYKEKVLPPKPLTLTQPKTLAPPPKQKPTAPPSSNWDSLICYTKGDGNCAAYSLGDELSQRGIPEYLNISQENQNRLLRNMASEYITRNLEKISAAEGGEDAILYAFIKTSLEDAKIPVDALDKKANLNRYAKMIKEDKKWLDTAFFTIMAKVLDRQIVILRPGEKTPIIMEEKFPVAPINQDTALFLYYNGKREKEGNHFQSIDLKEAKSALKDLINKDIEEKIDAFLQVISDSQSTQAELNKKLDDLKHTSNLAYNFIIQKMGSDTIDDSTRIALSTLTKDELLKALEPSPLVADEEEFVTPTEEKKGLVSSIVDMGRGLYRWIMGSK